MGIFSSSKKSKSKKKVKLPELTPQQRALEATQLQIAEAQLTAVQGQAEFQRKQFAVLEPLVQQQEADAAFARERAEALAPFQDQLFEMQLDRLRAGPGGVGEPIDLGGRINLGGPIPLEATPEQIRLIDESTDAAIRRGGIDIERFTREQLRRLFQEEAPARGLRSGDTPIQDRGGFIGAEATRQFGGLVERAQFEAAQQRLNLPLLAAERTLAERGLNLEAILGERGLNLESGLGTQVLNLGGQQLQGRNLTAAQLIAEQRREALEGLRQSAFANRLALTGQTGVLGANLATNLPFAVNPAVAAGQNLRLGAATVTTRGKDTSSPPAFDSALQVAGFAGGFLSGLSSKVFKEDIREIDADLALETVARLPISSWRYKGDDKTHIGAMAEDYRDETGLGDGVTIDLRDEVGLNLSATQALVKRVEELEAGGGLGLRTGGGLGLRAA